MGNPQTAPVEIGNPPASVPFEVLRRASGPTTRHARGGFVFAIFATTRLSVFMGPLRRPNSHPVFPHRRWEESIPEQNGYRVDFIQVMQNGTD
jgi:hypothetical protein